MASSRYLAASVARRERVHRGSVAAAIVVLALLAVTPLLGHHLPLGLEERLAGRDHVWALCLVALHVVLTPIHGLFHLLVSAGLVYAAQDRVRAWLAARRALGSLLAVQPEQGSVLRHAAIRARVDPALMRVVSGLPDPAFTIGWLRPLIYVARELPRHLTEEQLAAVLAHEHAHVLRRDPLRFSILRFIRCTLFWLPTFAPLTEDLADEAEIQADDAAAHEPLALAAAIVVLATWSAGAARLTSAVGFQRRDLLERRVRRLAGEAVAPSSRVSRRAAVAAACILGFAFITTAAVSHPMPGTAIHDRRHCDDHGAAAVMHLFCSGFSGPRDDCPHSRGH